MATNEDLARRGIEAFNTDDWTAMRGLCAPDLVYDETGTGRHLVGVDDVLEAFQGWKAALPDCTGEVLRIVAAGDTTVLEVRWIGTHTGPMPLGGSVLAGSDRPIDVLGTMWQRWQDGRMVEERNQLDVMTLLTQLGALPTPSPA